MGRHNKRRDKHNTPRQQVVDISEVTEQTEPTQEELEEIDSLSDSQLAAIDAEFDEKIDAAPERQPDPPAPEPSDIAIRYATPEDVEKIHFFCCLVSRPVLLAPINATKAWMEIDRICRSKTGEFALIAEINGEIVGTLGIVTPDWWYSDWDFMTDRWFFTIPTLTNRGIGAALLAEAALIAHAVNRTLIINGKPVKKNRIAGTGVYYVAHNLVSRQVDDQTIETGRH